VTAARIAFAAVLAAAAVVAVLLAADVRSSRSALVRGDAVYAETPSRARWNAETYLGGAAASLLGTRDDVLFRDALQEYVDAAKLHLRLDNALDVESARARAQDSLERAARTPDPRRASQALTLLGILAFRAAASGGTPSQVDAALSNFTDAVRSDPRNEDAAYDLELLLRLSAARGTRVEPGRGGGFGRSGRRGAAGGVPGSGY
jgi:hypothetical protein